MNHYKSNKYTKHALNTSTIINYLSFLKKTSGQLHLYKNTQDNIMFFSFYYKYRSSKALHKSKIKHFNEFL